MTAGLLDACGFVVTVGQINDPGAFDVEITNDGVTLVGIEVKDKVVGSDEADRVMSDAAAAGIPRCWLVATAAGQPLFDAHTLFLDGLRSHGVIFAGYSSIRDFVAHLVASPTGPIETIQAQLGHRIGERLEELGVTTDSLDAWKRIWESTLGS